MPNDLRDAVAQAIRAAYDGDDGPGMSYRMADAALSALTPTAPSVQEADQLTPQMVTEFAHRLERHGLEHDRFDPELPDCVAVCRGGNITCYLPISRAIAGEVE